HVPPPRRGGVRPPATAPGVSGGRTGGARQIYPIRSALSRTPPKRPSQLGLRSSRKLCPPSFTAQTSQGRPLSAVLIVGVSLACAATGASVRPAAALDTMLE